jgi:anti-sigma28 factor (negative regulator of flagellin synthesis)
MAATSPPLLAPAAPTPSLLSSASLRPSPTPTSAASPTADTPPNVPSLTSKEWIIPPRPKPGRKPATDTPPTKRKAQNRAAQRAFRERRAARVGELEEQMKQMEEEEEQKRRVLEADIERLQREVEQYSTNLGLWVEKCRRLERELAAERDAKSTLNNRDALSTESALLPGRTYTTHDKHNAQSSAREELPDVPLGCGNCTSATSCRCIDEAFNVLNAATDDGGESSRTKRPHSPAPIDTQKRVKPEPHDELETDFTTAFSSRPYPSSVPRPSDSSHDPCGFCQDGTPCICAEMAAEDARDRAAATSLHNAALQQSSSSGLMPLMNQLSPFTPPPSEGDVASTPQASQNVPHAAKVNSCASGPGTCVQCRTDPNSTLFCKALHASRSQSRAAPTVCCGTSSGCCQNSQSNNRTTNATRPTALTIPSDSGVANGRSIRLTCADAYTTLSRHPGYERASGDIASWMPKLHASSVATAENLEGRPAMEIDAANVMSVLKDFDRRFG